MATHMEISLACVLLLGAFFQLFVSGDETVCIVHNGIVGSCSQYADCNLHLFQSPQCSNSEVCCAHPSSKLRRIRSNKPKDKKEKKDKNQGRVRFETTTTTTTTTRAPDTGVPNLRIRGCGVRRTLTDFVIGGKNADFWPWMAAIFFQPSGAPESRFTCGGTVISKKYILTAAHCVVDGSYMLPADRVTVRVGGQTPMGDGQEYRVASIKVHENYQPNLHYDDIAVLKLSQDIASKNVIPACLPSTGMYNANFYKRNATVLGWGMTTFGGRTSALLQEAQLQIVSKKQCEPRYQRLGSLSLPRGIADTHLCAGTEDGSRDSCQGDSGGPLLVADQSSKWNVVGVVSFGYGCAEPDYPGVYTRVAKYLPWLRDNTDISPNR